MPEGRGFHWFVAMRYLRGSAYQPPRAILVPSPVRTALAAGAFIARWARTTVMFAIRTARYGSTPLRVLTALGLLTTIGAIAIRYGVLDEPNPRSFRPVDPWIQRTELVAIVAGAVT